MQRGTDKGSGRTTRGSLAALAGAVMVMVMMIGAAGCSKSATSSPQAKEKAYIDAANKQASGLLNSGATNTQAGAVACQTDFQTVSTALDLYRVAESGEPTKMADLVPKYLRQAPSEWEIVKGIDGKARIAPNAIGRHAGCTVPASG